MIMFLTRVWGSLNKLLKSLLDDANNDLYISGCQALGLASAQKLAPAHRAQFRECLLMIEQQLRAMFQKKQDDIRMKEQKILQEKEKKLY